MPLADDTTTLQLYAAPTEGSPISIEAAAYVSLAGRSLSTLVALRWFTTGESLEPLPLDTFYQVLLGSLVTVASTYRHVADALGAAEPSDIKPFQAWLTSASRQAFEVVEMPFVRDNRDKPTGAEFPAARPSATILADLDQLARDWLTGSLTGCSTPVRATSRPGCLRWISRHGFSSPLSHCRRLSADRVQSTARHATGAVPRS